MGRLILLATATAAFMALSSAAPATISTCPYPKVCPIDQDPMPYPPAVASLNWSAPQLPGPKPLPPTAKP